MMTVLDKEFTVEENKKRQVSGDVQCIDKNHVKLFINIYKLGKLKDIKELVFANKERCMIHVENIIKTTEYNLVSFNSDFCNGNERFCITLRK